MAVPDNYRVLDQFLQKEGWLAHVEGLDPVKLQALISLSQNDPLVPDLVKHCAAYLHHHQGTLTSYYARRLISTRPRCVFIQVRAEISVSLMPVPQCRVRRAFNLSTLSFNSVSRHDTTYVTHHAAINLESIIRYSYNIAPALALVIRNHVSPHPEYNFPTTASISEACQNLLDVYPQCRPLHHADDYAKWSKRNPGSAEDADDDEEFLTRLDLGPPDESVDAVDSLDPPSAPLPNRPSSQTSASDVRIPPYCKVFQPKLRALLYSLFTQLPGPQAKGRFYSPIFRYLVLASFGVDGKWSVANEITQDIAAFLFCGRLTLYSEIHVDHTDMEGYETLYS
jgi:hypothetical protein